MKKIGYTIAAVMLLMFLLLLPTYAAGTVRLSDLSEEECIDFIKQHNIQIPEDYPAETWAPFVKEIITVVEANPEYDFSFNYTVTNEFANQIKDAVNNYYGITSRQISEKTVDNYETMASNYVLQDSTAVTAWISMYASYNCYVYSIDTPEFVKVNPGYWSHQSFNLSMGLDTIAQYTMDDLRELRHERIWSQNTIDTTNLCTDEKIICVRLGTYDYHFMRFDNGAWYHKPGPSAILRYNYVPSVMRTWSNEALMASGPIAPTLYYDSNIIFISYDGHDWDYTSNGNGTHIRYCNICGDEETLNCEYEYTYFYDDMHNASCKYCDNGYSGAFCTFDFTSNGDGTHTGTCVCGNTQTYSCYMEYTNVSNATHSGSCVTCGYSVSAQQCTLVYEQNGGQSHTVSCTKCENRRTQNCSHRYVSHGGNTHSYLCSLCGYVKIDHAACLFDASNICRFCRTPKNGAVINKHEEVTPE